LLRIAVAGALFSLIAGKFDMKKCVAITVVIFVLMMSSPACVEKPPVPAPQPELPTTPSPAPVQPPLPVPEPAPEPAPELDEPEYSEGEICSLIWNRIPEQLTGGHSKSQLLKDTWTATYEGNGKWLFSVLGEVRQEGPLTTDIVRTDDCWVERESCEVTSYELQLTARFYENTKTLDIDDVGKINEQVTTETLDTPILRKEIKLHWLNAQYSGRHYYLEGCIENIGKIPVARLLVEFFLYGEDGDLLMTEKCKIDPDPIPSGERGKFKYDFLLHGESLSSYDCRFVSETGELFEYLEESGEEPVFFYEMDLDEATAESIIPRGLFSNYVMPLNKQVRDTTMSILSDVPEGISSNADAWKIWKIHNWVANNITYVSDPMGFEYIAYPHETLDCKAGDCDDFAVLLASMYEASGLDAMIAYIGLSGDKEVDHVACLVYYPRVSASFLEEEEIIISKLELSYPMGERYLKYLHSTDDIMPYKTSDIYDDYEEGIWIVADPIVTEGTGIVGYIIHEPYLIRAVDDVGA